MPTTQDVITDLQAQTLGAIKASQDAATESAQIWTNAFTKATLTPQTTNGLPSLFVDAVGDPRAIVDSFYDFAGQLLTLNKEFAHKWQEAVEPAPTKPAKASAK
jgi:hypothetical protein